MTRTLAVNRRACSRSVCDGGIKDDVTTRVCTKCPSRYTGRVRVGALQSNPNRYRKGLCVTRIDESIELHGTSALPHLSWPLVSPVKHLHMYCRVVELPVRIRCGSRALIYAAEFSALLSFFFYFVN